VENHNFLEFPPGILWTYRVHNIHIHIQLWYLKTYRALFDKQISLRRLIHCKRSC